MSTSYKGCSVVGLENETLVTASREFKKAIKVAKQNKKKQKAEKLKAALSHCNFKQFWNLVKKDCNFNLVTANCAPVNSLVDTFECNFVDSINNNIAVADFYSLYNKCDDIGSVVVHIDKVEKALFRLNSR